VAAGRGSSFVITLLVYMFMIGEAFAVFYTPVHRWSFDNAAGDATGAVIADLIGGADGVVQGAGAVFTGEGGLDLPGGSSSTQAYVDLPNGLISGLTDLTIEGWVTINNTNAWARIFDFGTGTLGELTSPGGNAQGTSYFMLTAYLGTNPNSQRLEIDDGVTAYTFDLNHNSPSIGTPLHFAVTYKADSTNGGGFITYYRDGVATAISNAVTSIALEDIVDNNNWLGRANWTSDANLDGTFHEFRIYAEALSAEWIHSSFLRGPDKILPTAFIVGDGPALEISWDAPGGVLECAPGPEGPWAEVPEGTNPTVLSKDGPGKYFRIRFE